MVEFPAKRKQINNKQPLSPVTLWSIQLVEAGPDLSQYVADVAAIMNSVDEVGYQILWLWKIKLISAYI